MIELFFGGTFTFIMVMSALMGLFAFLIFIPFFAFVVNQIYQTHQRMNSNRSDFDRSYHSARRDIANAENAFRLGTGKKPK